VTLGDWSRTELDQATASRRGGPGWRRHLQLELVELTSSVPRAARTPQPSGFTANLPEPAPVTKGNTASPAVGESAAPGWDECATRRIRSIYGRQLALPVGFGGENRHGESRPPRRRGPNGPPGGAGAGSSRRRGSVTSLRRGPPLHLHKKSQNSK